MKFSFKAMWNNKCPNCQKGDMYKKPFQLSTLLDMHEKCEKCDFDFEPEPGFYFGSLIISYGISAWMLLIPALTLVFYFKWSVNSAMIFTLIFAAIAYIKVIRGSRSLYLHLMARFSRSTWKENNSATKYDKTIF